MGQPREGEVGGPRGDIKATVQHGKQLDCMSKGITKPAWAMSPPHGCPPLWGTLSHLAGYVVEGPAEQALGLSSPGHPSPGVGWWPCGWRALCCHPPMGFLWRSWCRWPWRGATQPRERCSLVSEGGWLLHLGPLCLTLSTPR